MLDALEDVLHHHDRIVNNQTRCEHHTKQCKQVD